MHSNYAALYDHYKHSHPWVNLLKGLASLPPLSRQDTRRPLAQIYSLYISWSWRFFL